MSDMMRRAGIAAIAVTSLTTLIVGSVTAVQAATKTSSVKACVGGGRALVLSVHGKCPKGSHHVTLAQQGPRGPSGAPGPTSVYINKLGNGQTVTEVPASSDLVGLMPVKVPAGHFLVTLTTDVVDNNEVSADLFCDPHYSNGPQSPPSARVNLSVNQQLLYESGSAQDVETFTAPTTITAVCGTNAGNTGGSAGLYTASITAIPVGANHGAG
jgi:hypothetical protein